MNEAQSRSPDELERDIARTRADIDRTLTILQDRVSPTAIVDRAMRSTSEGGVEFASSLGRTVRDNPVPLTLLGISLGWLMLSNRDRGYQREAVGTREMDRSDPSRPSATYTSTVETTGIASTEYQTPGSSSDGGKASAAASAVRDKVSDTAASAADLRNKAQNAASDAVNKAGGKSEQVKQKAGETYGRVAETVAEKSDEFQRRAVDARGRASARASDALQDAQGLVRTHPILVGALALALGAGLAALFPRTQRENEIMGDKSDSLKDAARDTGTEQADKAKRAAAAAVAETKSEAGRQGLGSDDLRKELDSKAAAAKKVASAAVKAAGDEAKRESPSKPETSPSPSASTPGEASSKTPQSAAPKATAPAGDSSSIGSPSSSVKPGIASSNPKKA